MKYNEWRDELKNNLLSVAESERQRVLDYYAEAYADRREAGFSEREIIEEFGAPYDAAQRILAETAKTVTYGGNENPPAAESAPSTPEPAPAPAPVAQTAPVPQAAAPAAVKTKKSNKGWIIAVSVTAAVIVLLLAVILPVRAACRARKIKFTVAAYEAADDAEALALNIDAGSVKTEFYDGDNILIEYPVANEYKASVSEADGVVMYKADIESLPFWVSYDIPDAVIKLPKNRVFDITADVDAGSVYLADGKYGKLDLTVDAGSVDAGYIECADFDGVIAAGSLYAKEITCATADCNLSAGEIKILKLTCSYLKAYVDMGSAILGMTGAKSGYDVIASCSMGTSNLSSQTVAGAEKKMEVTVRMGTIDVTFDN